MQKIERYLTYIKQLLSDYASLSPGDGEAETQLIFDSFLNYKLFKNTNFDIIDFWLTVSFFS